jgi:spermidine/putrescine transport system ATP-binding protein
VGGVLLDRVKASHHINQATGCDAINATLVSKIFGSGSEAFKALDQVSVDIGQNEFFTLLGPSGCGKTTLLRLIAGFELPTSGQILLDGHDISGLPPFKRPVNTVFQNYALFPHMTVAQNISFGLEMQNRDRAEVDEIVARMLALVKMESMANRKTNEISGGQQQRVALARALAPRPKVLLLDEPLSALDLQLRKDMQIELKRLQTETGITFVFVTHDQEEALTMSDRIAVMNKGKILQIGTPREIYDSPQHRFVAGFIGEINLIEAKAASAGKAELKNTGMLASADIGKSTGKRAVTLAIRPERVQLHSKRGRDTLEGTLSNIVYHGTDTIYHFTLPNGALMKARSQNSSHQTVNFKPGNLIHWSVEPGSVKVVGDDPQ